MLSFLLLLPDFAFRLGIHFRPDGAVEIFREFFRVGERAEDAKASGRMQACSDALLESFRPVLGTPNIAGANPKELPGCHVETGKRRFFTVSLHPAFVGSVGLFNAAVVRDVLALSVNAVKGQIAEAGNAISAVLFDDATGLFEELGEGDRVPPVGEVALVIVLAAFVVETMRDLVADDPADAAVVHISRSLFGKENALRSRTITILTALSRNAKVEFTRL